MQEIEEIKERGEIEEIGQIANIAKQNNTTIGTSHKEDTLHKQNK